MSIPEQIQKDIVEAMRAREEHRLSTLRMVKSALKNKEIDKRSPLDEKPQLIRNRKRGESEEHVDVMIDSVFER